MRSWCPAAELAKHTPARHSGVSRSLRDVKPKDEQSTGTGESIPMEDIVKKEENELKEGEELKEGVGDQ